MNYKNKIIFELIKEATIDISKIAKQSGKFIRDAFLTEIVPRELKSKLKNYEPPQKYLKVIRPFLKAYGGFLAGFASIFLSKDPDLSTSMLKANSLFIYGLGDGIYDLLEKERVNDYFPPATLCIELPYNYISNLYKRSRAKLSV